MIFKIIIIIEQRGMNVERRRKIKKGGEKVGKSKIRGKERE